MSYQEHQQAAQPFTARCAVITLSDTRTQSTDKSGSLLKQLITENGHTVEAYKIIPDDPAELEEILQQLLSREDIDVILTTGGTGISRRDNTIPVLQAHIKTELPGFGELFRMLSYQQIGSGAMLSRAIAGITSGKILFALPGSTAACDLAMKQLILPELKHLLQQLKK